MAAVGRAFEFNRPADFQYLVPHAITGIDSEYIRFAMHHPQVRPRVIRPQDGNEVPPPANPAPPRHGGLSLARADFLVTCRFPVLSR